MQGETNVYNIIKNVLGAETAERYLNMCEDSKKEAFKTLSVSDLPTIPTIGLNPYPNTEFQPFVLDNPALICFPIVSVSKKTLSENFLDNIVENGIVVLPSEYFTIAPQVHRIGGRTTKKPSSKTRTNEKFVHKKRSYIVYKGKRGGLYINVMGKWKVIPKHSLNKQQ